jgi:hypothetical protein
MVGRLMDRDGRDVWKGRLDILKSLLVTLSFTGAALGQSTPTPVDQVIALSVQAYRVQNQDPARAAALEAQASQILAGLKAPPPTGDDIKKTISLYYQAEELCRHGQDSPTGEHGSEDEKTIQACGIRGGISLALESSGWCYGHDGQPEFHKKWEPCAMTGAPTVDPQPSAQLAGLMDMVALMDKMCRDESSDDQSRKMGCNNRDAELALIKTQGWVWQGGHWKPY